MKNLLKNFVSISMLRLGFGLNKAEKWDLGFEGLQNKDMATTCKVQILVTNPLV